MENRSIEPEKKYRLAWALPVLGVLLFVLGQILRDAFPASVFNFKIVSVLGILVTGLSVGFVVRSITAKMDPQAARRMAIAERDERMLSIRHRAGNAAYFFTFGLTTLVLLIYSGMTTGQSGFDLLWWMLSALVVVPAIVYVVMIAKLTA